MSAMPKPGYPREARVITAQEYLQIERKALYKSEFYDGRMFAMAGTSKGHNLITVNVTREFSTQTRGGPRQTYASDMRVKVSETGRYVYPDLVVVCDPPRFEDEELDTLLNPTLIVEVLSPSTESYDRGEKSMDYRQIESLQEYVLIAQNRPHLERYRRGDGKEWILSEAEGLEAVVSLTAIGCELKLADIYERLTFGEATATPESPSKEGRGESH